MNSICTLSLTEQAAAKVGALIMKENDTSLKLRVYVTGGGCSGFQYGFAFDDQIAEDDLALQQHGVTLLVDSMSHQYLQGASIDYQEDLQGARFVVSNPNATATCGCGSSFSI